MRFTRRRGLDDGLTGPVDDHGRISLSGLALPVVLAVLLVGVVGTATVLVRDRHDSAPSVELLRPADIGAAGGNTAAGRAAARAEMAATTYFTLDYRTVDADMDKMRALGTAAFAADYDAEAGPLARRVVRQRIVLTATVPREGVATEYLTADVAQVVVAVDVATRRDGSRSTSTYRTRVTLERSGDTWLVDAIDEVA